MLYSLSFSPPAEADHRGPAEFQRGEVPAFSRGASGEHHKWRRPHGRFVLYAWWPARAHRGRMQLRATGAAGSALRVHGQCRCTSNTVFPSRLLLSPSTVPHPWMVMPSTHLLPEADALLQSWRGEFYFRDSAHITFAGWCCIKTSSLITICPVPPSFWREGFSTHKPPPVILICALNWMTAVVFK